MNVIEKNVHIEIFFASGVFPSPVSTELKCSILPFWIDEIYEMIFLRMKCNKFFFLFTFILVNASSSYFIKSFPKF